VNRLILRLLRPYLIVAGLLTVAVTGYLFSAAAVIQRQLDAQGLPDCRDPNLCWPHGAAMTAVFGIELTAAVTPLVIGLVLGVALFARERAEDTTAFAPARSTPRGRWVLAKLGWALAAGTVCTGTVAVTHRLVTAPLTVLANDTYEMLELLHLNHPGFMTAQTAVTIVLAALAGLRSGRTLPTLVVAVAGLPAAMLCAFAGAGLLAVPLQAAFGNSSQPAASASFAGDFALADGLGWTVTALLAVGVAVLTLVASRTTTPSWRTR
jgi:hypothetical protein